MTVTNVPPTILTPRETVVGGWDEWAEWASSALSGVSLATPAGLYKTQPHLRTVISFLARNVAQLGLKTYVRDSATNRLPDDSSPLAQILHRTTLDDMTTYERTFALIGDLLLYDRAHWLIVQGSEGPQILRIPPAWIQIEDSNPFQVLKWRISAGKDSMTVSADEVLSWTGYSPTNPLVGSPAIESLRDTLKEQLQAQLYRLKQWKNGGRATSIIERPIEAPEWSDKAREGFKEDWYGYSGEGENVGKTPILEDGMTLKSVDFSAADQQFVEAAKLSRATVAAAFHVNPTQIGETDATNYSNVQAFREILYADTLGPILVQIEDRINQILAPRLGAPSNVYAEFNLDAKLRGNIVERYEAINKAVGRPWQSPDEARALENLAARGGPSDEIAIPVNMNVPGLDPPAPAVQANSLALDLIGGFLKRQESAVKSRKGAGAQWWDGERWDRELTAAVWGAFPPKNAPEIVASVNEKTRQTIETGGSPFGADRAAQIVAQLEEK